MAELILACVTLGVAVPGIVAGFAEAGEYFRKKIDHFQRAPSIITSIGQFGRALHEGQLKNQLALASWAYQQEDIDQGIKDILEDHIERLRIELISVDKQFSRCFDDKGNIRRARFVYSGEWNLRERMNELEQWQRSFWHTISLIEMRKRVLPDPLSLTPDKFKLFLQAKQQYYRPLTPNSHILLAKGQINDGHLREIAVLIEQKRKITTGVNEVKEIASCLSQQSSLDSPPPGILKCLGYRQEPQLELIFELPSNHGDLQTMDALIQADQCYGYGGRRPLDYRLR